MSVTRRHIRDIPEYMSGTVKAGVLEGATYPADTLRDARTGEEKPDPRAGMHVATIAAALEYGHGQNHPRPFMQTTVARERKTWTKAMVTLMVKQRMGAQEALMTVGQVMKEDIKTTVAEWPADNSADWAAFKGYNHGLVLTNHLHDSIESEIEPNEP